MSNVGLSCCALLVDQWQSNQILNKEVSSQANLKGERSAFIRK